MFNLSKISKFIKEKKAVFIVLASIVVSVTTYSLILPAFTLEKEEAEKQGGITIEEQAEQNDEAAVSSDEVKTVGDKAESEAAIDEKKNDASEKDNDADKSSDVTESEKKTESAEGTLSFASPDKDYKVELSYDEKAAIPDSAELVIDEIDSEKKEYKKLIKNARKTLSEDDKTIDSIKLYDISIMNDDTEIEPESTVDVQIDFNKGIKAANKKSVKIIHFTEDKDGKLVSEIIEDKFVEPEVKKEKLEKVSFQAESFSVFGVITTPVDTPQNEDTLQLGGKVAKLHINNSYMLPSTTENNPEKIQKTTDSGRAAEWNFDFDKATGEYYIYTTSGGIKRYMDITPYSGSNNSANVTLTGTPQTVKVNKTNDGTYTISKSFNNRTYYINLWEGGRGNGFAGWYSTDDYTKVRMDFVESATVQENYAVVIHHTDGNYYIVRADGSLEKVTYNAQDNTVEMQFPMTWMYRSVSGGHVIRMAAEAVTFDGNQLPTSFAYRYIDPNSDSGTREETITDKHIDQDLTSACLIQYDETNKNIHGVSGGVNNYIGVSETHGKLHIIGNTNADNAAEVLFANVKDIPEPFGDGNTVNHIDISVKGSVDISVPLAYGTYYYYDENNEVKTLKVSADKPVVSKIHNYEVAIKKADMMKADITAFKKNADGSTTVLNNMFYVTGYSANGDESGGPENADQVRFEGSFKVSYTNVPGQNGNEASRQARLNTPVYYTVNAPKDVTVPLQYTYTDNNNQTHTYQLYSSNPAETGESPLTTNATVNLSASFNYWDFDNNKCPAAMYHLGGDWHAGDIPDGLDYDRYHSGSGMDFVLGGTGTAQAKVYAIEITKILVDENGNRIKAEDPGSNTFHVFRKGKTQETTIADLANSVKDLNIGSATETPDYSGYYQQDDVTVDVGAEGVGISFDYDVSPALYYIQEDPQSIKSQITDNSGKTWDYKETYFLTEYAWRNHPNDNYMHVSEKSNSSSGEYKSVPEILGDHPSYDGSETFTNDFLEFYVYNVYESPKVDVPVEKTWPDFDQNEAYDWNATFRLQWAPLYSGETTPSEEFQDVIPLKTMTITKDQMKDAESQAASLSDRTFKDLPKYGTDKNGNTFRYQYSLEETSYQVTEKSSGSVIYSWDDTQGYNLSDEDTHYQPFYPHDAGEDSDEDSDYYIQVKNAKRNISQKEYIDVSFDKQWDSSFGTRQDSWFAEFELRRFAHTEYRDVSHMSDSDRDPERAVTVTIKDETGNELDKLKVQPNVGVYVAGNFKAHNGDKSISFSSDHPVRLPSGSHVSSISVTAEGSNESVALVRSQEFFVTQDTVFTLTSGAENLISDGKIARVLDTSAGTSPLPDKTFSRTIRLDNTNNWHVDLNDLIRSETSAGEDDHNENITYYEYYFVEIDSSPKGYARYFRANSSGEVTEVLSGDSDHQIEGDDKIVAVNGPANRLVVKKNWRGVPDATGFPHVTFTLYQGWANSDGTVSSNSGDSWVYENENTHVKYEHVELPSTSLEWICPEVLPETKMQGSTSRAVGYYVVEDVQYGSATTGNITTSWGFYYYINSEGKRTNSWLQGYYAGLTGSYLAENGGEITIVNELSSYTALLINKKFFELHEAGSWADTTAHSERMTNTVLGFKVMRAIKTSDGKYLDEKGQPSEKPVWMDYGDEMMVGYGATIDDVLIDNGNNDFHLENAGGEWHFRIKNNREPNGGSNEQIGLPKYGFYVSNGQDIAVEYEYTYRETNVYKDLNRTPYDNWDWYSSVLPLELNPIYGNRKSNEVANFQASDLKIHKQWIGDVAASEVYVKLWRVADGEQPEDFTAVIAEDIKNNNNWQMYMNDTSQIDLDRNWLILKDDGSGQWTDALKVNRALVGTTNGAKEYHYYIQEVAYKAIDGTIRTNVNGKFKPLYDKWVDGHWTDAPAGMNNYAGNNIKIGAKGENQLKVINRTSPSTSYTITKDFAGTQSSTSGQSSVSGKYPTDGSKQVVVELQQRYRYEKTEDGVDYVSADNETWTRADDPVADNIWTVGWQGAESANPTSVVLPLDKPEGSTLSDEAWYGSKAAWTYTWEGLDLKKVISEDADPTKSKIAQLYYRAVETSTPDWINATITEEEQDGHKAIDDDDQSPAEIASEQNTVTNNQGRRNLKLSKEWTGIGSEKTWPKGYVVYYQLIQNCHLAVTDVSGSETRDDGITYVKPEYSYRQKAFKSIDMTTQNTGGSDSDRIHPQATGTLEKSNHNLDITGLPMYGFVTATEEDVAKAAEDGVALTVGRSYPVVYTYSARETAVKKNGVDVDFKQQTVNEVKTTADGNTTYSITLRNELTSVEVTKTWADSTPYADSVKVKLYRTTAVPQDQLCQVTINLTFGDNYDQITSETIYATVGGTSVPLQKDGNKWTGTVGLEKGTTADIHYEQPDVNEGYVVTLNDGQISVPSDQDTYEAKVSGSVNSISSERTVTVNVTWEGDVNPNPSYTNLYYANWQRSGISSSQSENSGTRTFVWNGVDASKNAFVQLGYNGYTLGNFDISTNGTSTRVWVNNSNELILDDIQPGSSPVVINVTIKPDSGTTGGNGSITLVNNTNGYIWINSLQRNGERGKFSNGWMANGSSDTIGNLEDGEYTVQVGQDGGVYVNQVEGADSVDQWGDASNGNVNIHIVINNGESRTITINAATRAMQLRTLKARAPMLNATAVTPSDTQVSLNHNTPSGTTELEIVGNEDYPTLTAAEFVDDFNLTANGEWYKEWSELPAYDPETGLAYHYYVLEEVPENTKQVTYSRVENEETKSTTVTINNEPIENPEYASIKVTKAIKDADTNKDLDIDRSFTIRLKQGDKYLKWTDSYHYEWVSSVTEASTWTFNNGGSVTFTGLDLNKEYTVIEDTSAGMIEISGYDFDTQGSTVSYAVTTVSETLNEVIITNKYRQALVDLDILKVDKDDNTQKLTGAVFQMTKLIDDTYIAFENDAFAVNEKDGNKKTGPFTITSEDGIKISGLTAGQYKVQEIAPPAGYVIKEESFTFTINNDGSITYNNGNSFVKYTAKTEDANDKFQVANESGAELPSAGGPGTHWIYLIGAVLVIGCAIALIAKKRCEN